jgi:hypothetical protein
MITLISPNVQPYPGHLVTCTKKIGTFLEGKQYHVALQKCTGKKFESLQDTKGEVDDRYMIFTTRFGEVGYAINKKSILDEHFIEE